MRINNFGTRAYTYRVLDSPTKLPISLQTARSYLKIKTSINDPLIDMLIIQATDFAEKITGRCFINRTIQTFRDFFPNTCDSEGYYLCGEIPGLSNSAVTAGSNTGFEIKRSPLVIVDSISYLVNGVSNTVDPSIYYNTIENDYSEILTLPGQCWPENADKRLQSITITFTCGFGDEESDVPQWAKTGILHHIAYMYENRGDCIDSSGSCDCSTFLPPTSRAIYFQNRIHNL